MGTIKRAIQLMKENNTKTTSMHRRLFMFFTMIIVFVLASFMTVLLLFDLSSNEEAVSNYLDTELGHISADISEDMGTLSVQGVNMSEDFTDMTERFFLDEKINLRQLMTNNDYIEKYLGSLLPTLSAAINSLDCSGAFIVLAKNPENTTTRHSGLYLKKTATNTIGAVTAKVYCLRGSAKLARKYGIELLGQWKMEFNEETEDFFSHVMKTAKEHPELPLSCLYYWSERFTLEDNSESGFLLSIPLLTKNGEVFGVCGYELSDRLFKQLYTPDNSVYPGAFATLATGDDAIYHIDRGMIAGNSFLTGTRINSELHYTEPYRDFTILHTGNTIYAGRQTTLRIYASNSPYADTSLTTGVMMDYNTLREAVNGNRRIYIGISVVLLVVSLFIALLTSRRFLRPVTEGLNDIKKKDYARKSNKYLEINDLMEYLDEQEKSMVPTEVDTSSDLTPLFHAFLANVRTLSPAERNVFDLYIKGYTAKEIAEELFLSINTIKTHNRRIFTKLNVSTRKELMVYIDMMKDMNLIEQVGSYTPKNTQKGSP